MNHLASLAIVATAFFTLTASSFVWADEADEAVKRGAYLAAMGGCASCHTDKKGGGATFAGGVALKTPFGTFNVPNITPANRSGIGRWTKLDFIKAMREGVSPDGDHFYPAFPYTSYTKMTSGDLLDLKAYLDNLPPIRNEVPDHDLSFPFSIRPILSVWKQLFFKDVGLKPIEGKSPEWNRGRYIVEGPGHCGECHTPRNIFGALDQSAALAGNPKGPDGDKVPSLLRTGDSKFAKWKDSDISFALETGMMPDGDFFSGSMGKVVENTTSKLSKADRDAIIEYLNTASDD